MEKDVGMRIHSKSKYLLIWGLKVNVIACLDEIF